MVNLHGDDFHRVDAALRLVPFNCIFARSVLDGLVDGRVWLDDERRPTFVHVVHPYGMTLLVVLDPDADRRSLHEHLKQCPRPLGGLWLQLHPQGFAGELEKILGAAFATGGHASGHPSVQRFTRVNFCFDRTEYARRHPRPTAASSAAIRPMTAGEFAMAGITVSPHMFWRNAEQFLSHGGGWCVDNDGVVSSIAFTSFRQDSQLELGVETRPEHRGNGYGRLACAALIDQCLASGLDPVWSCRKENVASYRLAQSLGFVPTFEGAYYHLAAIDSRKRVQP